MQDFQGEVKVWNMWLFLMVAKHDILSGCMITMYTLAMHTLTIHMVIALTGNFFF